MKTQSARRHCDERRLACKDWPYGPFCSLWPPSSAPPTNSEGGYKPPARQSPSPVRQEFWTGRVRQRELQQLERQAWTREGTISRELPAFFAHHGYKPQAPGFSPPPYHGHKGEIRGAPRAPAAALVSWNPSSAQQHEDRQRRVGNLSTSRSTQTHGTRWAWHY